MPILQMQFVAGFIGSPKMNFIKGKLAEMHGTDVCGIRPEHIKLSFKEGEIKATLKHLELLGEDSICHLNRRIYISSKKAVGLHLSAGLNPTSASGTEKTL